ncbi:hypothetical protein SDC9_149921 [bioreactor metagenome]|uniref:Uncharacterized protein n=1 Tax=bioreactor metagenome TaxID=1076179 RepID=A0A645EKZ0_9ZZZZ
MPHLLKLPLVDRVWQGQAFGYLLKIEKPKAYFRDEASGSRCVRPKAFELFGNVEADAPNIWVARGLKHFQQKIVVMVFSADQHI